MDGLLHLIEWMYEKWKYKIQSIILKEDYKVAGCPVSGRNVPLWLQKEKTSS
jgi:hypothetical protein